MIGLLLAVIYLSFISLGLPDAVLGSAWPIISEEFSVPVSNMGIITVIISAGTVVSSLNSGKIINRLGEFKTTFLSVLLTAVSLLGYAFSPNFTVLCLWSVPYGLGAGSVDAALNNYVSVHFESKHMNWLHCMWGLGATAGPYIMGMALTNNLSYNGGYVILFAIQAFLCALIFLSKPVWSKANTIKMYAEDEPVKKQKSLTLKQVFQIKGVKQICVAFFCFCAIEQTTGLWAASYLVYVRFVQPEIAASFAAIFYLGITVGRGISGFIAMKYSDKQMIRAGCLIMAVGGIVLFLPLSSTFALLGLILIGLGSAPVYPCVIHSTPFNFGIENSQSVIGVQMAMAYVGTLTMPALFGVIGRGISFSLYPVFIAVCLLGLIIMYEWLQKKIKC